MIVENGFFGLQALSFVFSVFHAHLKAVILVLLPNLIIHVLIRLNMLLLQVFHIEHLVHIVGLLMETMRVHVVLLRLIHLMFLLLLVVSSLLLLLLISTCIVVMLHLLLLLSEVVSHLLLLLENGIIRSSLIIFAHAALATPSYSPIVVTLIGLFLLRA